MPIETRAAIDALLVLALLDLHTLFAQINRLQHLCRAALTANRARRRIDVDSYEELTRDIISRGHYYCDKAPGMGFRYAGGGLFSPSFSNHAATVYSRLARVLYLCALTTSGLLCAARARVLQVPFRAHERCLGRARGRGGVWPCDAGGMGDIFLQPRRDRRFARDGLHRAHTIRESRKRSFRRRLACSQGWRRRLTTAVECQRSSCAVARLW